MLNLMFHLIYLIIHSFCCIVHLFLNDIDIKFSMPWLLWLLFLFLLCAWLGVENILFLVILVLTPDSYLLPLRLLALEIGNHVFITDFLFFFLISRIKIIPIMNLGVPLHGLPHVILFFLSNLQ